MKHAAPTTIDSLTALLDRIRALPGLREVKPGIFYRKSRAFLHFHEDGDDVYADVRLTGPDFERLPCTTRRDRTALVSAIARYLEDASAGQTRQGREGRSRSR